MSSHGSNIHATSWALLTHRTPNGLWNNQQNFQLQDCIKYNIRYLVFQSLYLTATGYFTLKPDMCTRLSNNYIRNWNVRTCATQAPYRYCETSFFLLISEQEWVQDAPRTATFCRILICQIILSAAEIATVSCHQDCYFSSKVLHLGKVLQVIPLNFETNQIMKIPRGNN